MIDMAVDSKTEPLSYLKIFNPDLEGGRNS